MAIVTINDENLTNIASAIRAKNGTENTYKPSDMAAAIAAIVSGGSFEGFNTEEYDITILSRLQRAYAGSSYAVWKNWGDYITDFEDVYLLIYFHNSVEIYIKGLFQCEADKKILHTFRVDQSSGAWMEITNYDADIYSIRFNTTNGALPYREGSAGTPASWNNVYLITKKEA